MVEPENNNKPLDDSEHGQIEALKGEIKSLHETMEKMLDSIAQTTATQNQLAKASLKAKETADAAMAELTKTKNELANALQQIQQNNQVALPTAIKQGMQGFADEIKKSTDERITQILGNTTASVDGKEVQSPVQVVRPGAGNSIGDLIGAIVPYIEPITKLIVALRPPPPAVAPLADQLTNFLRLQKVLGDLNSANVDIEKFHKAATEALKPIPTNQPSP